VTEDLARFLPVPLVAFNGKRYFLDYDRPDSIGKVGPFYGAAPNILRAYAWVMGLGAEGLREAAEVAVLNNNYLLKKALEIPGLSAPYAYGKRRIEQVRYSCEQLAQETGVQSADMALRAADWGAHFFLSHHPFVVPEPATIEPTESYSQADLDEHAAILAHIAEEARTHPERVKTAPHHAPIHRISDHDSFDDPAQWAITWRAFRSKLQSHHAST
jgi:glycine dehydrogenase subunit 2